MTQTLQEAAQRLEDWLVHQCLPLWQKRGLDRESGGHHEQLNADGSIDRKANIRVRVQSRQAFTFAFASHRGWCQGQGQARQLMQFLENSAAHPSAGGGFTHLMDPDFQVTDTKQDLYDHAFAFLAYAWCYRALGDRACLEGAEALIRHLDQRFASPYGGWTEGDYGYASRRQNPHMHLFEAMMALYEASGQAHWLARAGEIFTLFQTRFYDLERELLYEYFTEDWRLNSTPEEARVEPGHMMEWVWLLDWYRRLTGHPVEVYTQGLYRRGLAMGLTASGLLMDEVSGAGQPLKPTKRLWGMTELVKASLVRAKEGEPGAEERALEAINRLFDYYLCATTPGAYLDQMGSDDRVSVAKAPASSLYHLVVMVAEVRDYVQAFLTPNAKRQTLKVKR